MRNLNGVDLGSVKIHKKVIADIVAAAINEVPGVSLMAKDPLASIKEVLGCRGVTGIKVAIEENGQVNIEVKINVRYGINLPDAARQTQEAVRVAIEKTVDIDLKDVNVSIQGIERTTSSS